MKEHIERAALKRELAPYEENDFSQQMDVILAIVDAQPTADVVEVRHGRWEMIPYNGVCDMRCSACGFCPGIRFFSSKYCPQCGAFMCGGYENDTIACGALMDKEAAHD